MHLMQQATSTVVTRSNLTLSDATDSLVSPLQCSDILNIRKSHSRLEIPTPSVSLQLTKLFCDVSSHTGGCLSHSIYHEPEQLVWPEYQSVGKRSCMRQTTAKSETETKKSVSFDGGIEIREHQQILGDNPCPRKGPAISLDWFDPTSDKVLTYTVEDFETMRTPIRKKKLLLSPLTRMRLLVTEVGVEPDEIFAAREEAWKILRSRRQHNIFARYDRTALALETCFRNLTRFVTTGSLTEIEMEMLMFQAELAQRRMPVQ